MTPLTSSILGQLDRDDIVFTTTRAAQLGGTSVQSAARVLQSMARNGLVTHVTRGLWAITSHPDFSPYAVLPFILDAQRTPTVAEPWNTPIDIAAANQHASRAGYVSFVSALHLHGMLSQIPREIHVAVPRQRHALDTSVARYVFHRLTQYREAETVSGDRWGRFALATPAQALVDTMYVSVHRGRHFAHLPEIELPVNITPTQTRAHRRSPQVQMARLFGEVDVLIAGIQRPVVRDAVLVRWALLRASIRAVVLATGD
jgi:hypothetical protein